MNNIQYIFKKWAGIIGSVCLPALMLSSCVKNNNNTVQPAGATLAVIDASPDAPSFDFYLGYNQVNSVPLIYSQGIYYFNAPAGKSAAIFYDTGTRTKVVTDSITLAVNRSYSLFICNVIATPDFVLLADTVNQPAAGMGSIRFVDLSPDAPAVDFVIRNGASLVTSKTYKSFSTFVPILVKSNDTLDVRQAGTTTVLASIPGISIQEGSVYTVWLEGLYNTTNASEKIGLNIMINANFY